MIVVELFLAVVSSGSGTPRWSTLVAERGLSSDLIGMWAEQYAVFTLIWLGSLQPPSFGDSE